MKHIRTAANPADEHSGDVKANEQIHVPNKDNKIFHPQPGLNKTDELKLKVFIADDSSEVRNRLKEMIEENKSISLVGEAADAEQAILALHDLKPDVVILDIHMPEGGGMRVLKDIKATGPEMIMIIITAFPYAQHRQAYLAAGANYFLDKTNDIQMMTKILAELVQRHLAFRNSFEK